MRSCSLTVHLTVICPTDIPSQFKNYFALVANAYKWFHIKSDFWFLLKTKIFGNNEFYACK